MRTSPGWATSLDLPARLPLPASTRRDTIRGRYRVYMNYCTVSYTATWWNWERWQREIDYMAMNSRQYAAVRGGAGSCVVQHAG